MNDITKEIDILEIFSSLNNHEVFTPPIIAKQMIDLLPKEVFKNPQSKFLDPAVKTGIFLRELAFKLHKELADYSNNGDTEIIGFDGCYYDMNNPKERMNHILKNMLFGIATSEVTAYLSRRTLYGVMEANSNKEEGVLELLIDVEKEKSHDAITAALGNVILNEYYDHDLFNDQNYEWHESEGNIFYPNNEVSDLIENISEEDNISEIEESYFPFIDERTEHRKINEIKIGKRKNFKTGETEDMKFDVIIGNPPYQISDGGQGASAKPIYHKFIENAIDMSPRYISFIVPSRWFVGGKGLDKFREQMLNDKRIKAIVDFPESKDCFPSVDIKGGVNYFLWDKNHNSECTIATCKKGILEKHKKRFLNEFGEIFIRDNKAIKILHKVQKKKEKTMDSVVSSRKPFGFPTNFINFTETKSENSIKIFANKKIGFIDKNLIEVGSEFLSKYLVLITEASGSGSDRNVLTKPIVTDKGSCCTETYLIVNSFNTLREANILNKYIKTKFFRFLVSLIKNTQHGTKKVYRFVPYLPMDQEWTDEKLYKRYNLTQEEINYIEERISPME